MINLIDFYTGPYSEAVLRIAQRISWSRDYFDFGQGGNLEKAYKLMRKFYDREYPFDDTELWGKHYGAEIWHDPDDIYDIGWFTVDNDGNCELRDCAKEYLHFAILDRNRSACTSGNEAGDKNPVTFDSVERAYYEAILGIKAGE